METTNPTKSYELTEAAGLTEIREAAIRWIQRRLFKDTKPSENTKLAELLNTRFLLRLGNLVTGTKSTKVTEETEVDVVLKAFETYNTTDKGETVKVIFLNQRIGLDKMRKPLNHSEKVERIFGAVCTALIGSLFPPEPDKNGKLRKTREHNEALTSLGFPYWNVAMEHAKVAVSRIAPKVVFAVDAFEIPKAVKANEAREEYRLLICDESGKELKSLKCSKSDFENFSPEATKLIISFRKINPTVEAMARKALKQLKRTKDAEADKLAEEAKALEQLEDAESFE